MMKASLDIYLLRLCLWSKQSKAEVRYPHAFVRQKSLARSVLQRQRPATDANSKLKTAQLQATSSAPNLKLLAPAFIHLKLELGAWSRIVLVDNSMNHLSWSPLPASCSPCLFKPLMIAKG